MVSVDNKVVGRLLHIAALLHIGAAVVGIFPVKAVLQVEVWLIHRLHHGMVDVSICNADSAHQITVLPVQFRKLRQNCLFLGVLNLFHRFRSGIVLRRSIHHGSQLNIKLGLLIWFLIVIDNKISACVEDDSKHHNEYQTNIFFIGFSFPESKLLACCQASSSRFCCLIFRAQQKVRYVHRLDTLIVSS